MKVIEGLKGEFIKIVSDAFVAVLSQTSGNAWEAADTQASAEEPAFSTRFAVSGAVEGPLAVECAVRSGRVIAHTLLGESGGQWAGSGLETDEVEALQEFFQQVMGLAQSAASSKFGEIEIKASAPQENVTSAEQFPVGARFQETEITFLIDVDGLSSAKVKHTKSALGEKRSDNLDLLMNVTLPVVMRFGERQMRLREILELGSGAVVELNRRESEPVELLLDNKLIARGEVVIVEGNYGLRILEVATAQARLEAVQR